MTGATVTGPLLERSGELARIESALTEARSGSGTFVVIEGPAGIGKTSLLAATRAAALENGMRVLRARATELEREFAFGVVRQLFEPALVDASDAERAELLEGAAGVAAGLLGLGGRAIVDVRRGSEVDHSFAILHGLYWLCANLAVVGPLCVVVDDAQWADAPSLRYLAFLVTRLEELSVTPAGGDPSERPGRRRGAARDADDRALCGRRPSPSSNGGCSRPTPGIGARGRSGSALRRRLPPCDARHAVLGGRARGGTARRWDHADRAGCA
jgi:hypothetical protein